MKRRLKSLRTNRSGRPAPFYLLPVLLLSGVAITAPAAEKEERGVFRLHAVFDQYNARTKPMKVLGKREMYNLDVEPKFADRDVQSARSQTGDGTNRIVIKFKPASATRLKQFTTEMRGKRIGLVLMNKLVDAPLIRQPITNGEVVVPVPTKKDADEVAKYLEAAAHREKSDAAGD